MNWPKVPLQDIALHEKGAIVSGPFGSNISAKYFVDEGVPVIRGNNLSKGRTKFIDEGFAYLTEAKAAEFRNCIAVADDIVFTAAGSIGQVGIIPPDSTYEEYVISNKQLRVRLDKCKANPDFVYAWLSSPLMVRYLESMNNGGAVPLLNLGIIRKVPVPLPPIETQVQIADILSTYNDLIENNLRRIALLEQAARLLYREWFVHFRFPGHEHVKIIDGVPEGWGRLPASEAFQINPRTPRTDDSTIAYLPMASLPEGGMVIDTGELERREKSTSVRFRNGDTLFARITPCLENGKTGFVQILGADEVACGSTEFIVLRGRHVSDYFVYLTARQPDFRENAIKSMIGSSGRQRVQPSCFDRYLVPVPPDLIAELFAEAVEPMFEQINRLDRQSQWLAQARDLLLPRLMSGEMVV